MGGILHPKITTISLCSLAPTWVVIRCCQPLPTDFPDVASALLIITYGNTGSRKRDGRINLDVKKGGEKQVPEKRDPWVLTSSPSLSFSPVGLPSKANESQFPSLACP